MATDALARLMGSGRRGGGGGSNPLPPVTDADNGDVLMVVNGAWDKGTIHAAETFEIEKNGAATVQMSSDIYQAVVDGKQIYFKYDSSTRIPLIRLSKNSDTKYTLYFELGYSLTDYYVLEHKRIVVEKDLNHTATIFDTETRLAYYVAP